MSIQYRFSLGKKDAGGNLLSSSTPNVPPAGVNYAGILTVGSYYRYQFQLNSFDASFLGQGQIYFGDIAVPGNFNPISTPFIYEDERQCLEGTDFGFIFTGFAAASIGQMNFLYERIWNAPSVNMPLGWDSISRTYQYEDTLNIFNEVFDFNLTFYGSDYQFINEFIDTNGSGTALPIRIEKKCNDGDWVDYYIGEINLTDPSTVFNVEKCTVIVKPSNISPISKLVQGKDNTFNLSSYPVNYAQPMNAGYGAGPQYGRFWWVDMFSSTGDYFYQNTNYGQAMPFYTFAELLTMAVLTAANGAVKVNVDYFLTGITTDKDINYPSTTKTVIPGIVNGNDDWHVYEKYSLGPASSFFAGPKDASMTLSDLFKNLDAIYNLCMYADTDVNGVTTVHILPKQLYMDETPVLTLNPSGIEFSVNGDNAPNVVNIGYTLYQYQTDEDLDAPFCAYPKTFGDAKTWQSDWCWDPHWINRYTDCNHFGGGISPAYVGPAFTIPGFLVTYAIDSGTTWDYTTGAIPFRAVCYAGNLPNNENDPTSNMQRRMWTLAPAAYRNYGRGKYLLKNDPSLLPVILNHSLPYFYKFDYPMSEADFDLIAGGKFISLMVKGVAKLGYILSAKRDEKSSLVNFVVAGQ